MMGEVSYDKNTIDEEYDEDYMHILESYYDSQFKEDALRVSKEIGLSKSEKKNVASLYRTENNKDKKKWKLGENCRTLYYEDLLMYEAVIKKIKGGNAVVQFHGYENEQQVPLRLLMPSKGEAEIRKQIQQAQEDKIVEYSGDEGDIILEEEEAEEIDDTSEECSDIETEEDDSEEQNENVRKVCLDKHMLTVTLNNAKNYRQVKRSKSTEAFNENREIQPEPSSGHSKLHSKQEQPAGPIVPPLVPPTSSSLLITPKNEEEALACMLSSCYLSGYYTGYYASVRKNGP